MSLTLEGSNPSEIATPITEMASYQFYYQDNTAWAKFDSTNNSLLNNALNAHQSSCQITVNSKIYNIDFKQKRQALASDSHKYRKIEWTPMGTPPPQPPAVSATAHTTPSSTAPTTAGAPSKAKEPTYEEQLKTYRKEVADYKKAQQEYQHNLQQWTAQFTALQQFYATQHQHQGGQSAGFGYGLPQ